MSNYLPRWIVTLAPKHQAEHPHKKRAQRVDVEQDAMNIYCYLRAHGDHTAAQIMKTCHMSRNRFENARKVLEQGKKMAWITGGKYVAR